MATSVNWITRVITVPQADLTPLGGNRYQFDVDAFRLELKDLEDDEGIPFPDTHRHNTEVVLAGVTYSRTFEIINGYTIFFEETGTPYEIQPVNANHNLLDVKVVSGQTSLSTNNSAGLQTVNTGGGGGDFTALEISQIRYRLGLDGATAVPTAAPDLAQELDVANAQAAIQIDIANLPSAADMADAVWDEPRADHTTTLTYGATSEWTGGGGSSSADLEKVTVRTARVGEAFLDVFTLLDAVGSPVSGELAGDFTVRASQDGVTQAVVSTIGEIGSTGDYVISVPAGFPGTGLWVLTVESATTSATKTTKVEVRTDDIDSVGLVVDEIRTLVIGGGTGVETVEITLVDTLNGNAGVADALLNIYDATGTTLVTFERTDPSGIVTVLLNPATYVIRGFSPGVSIPETQIVVADNSGVGTQQFQIDAQSVQVAAPASPTLCRMFDDFLNLNGTALVGQVVQVQNLYDPNGDQGLSVLQGAANYTTDAAGHVEFDVVRGARIRISFPGSNFSRDITVPDSQTAKLTTTLGLATDNFTIVTD